MRVDIELLPQANAIVEAAQAQLQLLFRYPIKLKMVVDRKEISMQAIRDLVCEIFDVRWETIKSKNRKHNIVIARHAYCYMCLKYVSDANTVTLGEELNRDHSSIVHARENIKSFIFTNDNFVCSKLDRIESELLKL